MDDTHKPNVVMSILYTIRRYMARWLICLKGEIYPQEKQVCITLVSGSRRLSRDSRSCIAVLLLSPRSTSGNNLWLT